METRSAATSPPEIAPDGSPVAVFAAVPAEPGLTPVLDAIPAGATVLDLGCGAGRLANVLAGRGHAVTGVDVSAAMLRHLDRRVRAVHGRIEDLDLAERHDVVVLASHLVHADDVDERTALLRAAARHLTPDGVLYVEHYEVGAKRHLADVDGRIGAVAVAFRVLARDGDVVDGQVTYELDGQRWTQPFRARLLDEADLDTALHAAGLERRGRLDPRWLVAGRPAA